ncbi:MAG: hypothetical protein ACXVOI_01940 [Tumebacillaceae bacterium]
MDWMTDLEQRLQSRDLFQISIDGQIWTADSRQGMITFTNEFGRQEQFDSPEHMRDALQSWYESPTIVVL